MRVGGIGNDPVVEDSGDDDSVTDTSDTAAADGSDPFTSGASRSRDSGSSSGTSSTGDRIRERISDRHDDDPSSSGIGSTTDERIQDRISDRRDDDPATSGIGSTRDERQSSTESRTDIIDRVQETYGVDHDDPTTSFSTGGSGFGGAVELEPARVDTPTVDEIVDSHGDELSEQLEGQVADQHDDLFQSDIDITTVDGGFLIEGPGGSERLDASEVVAPADEDRLRDEAVAFAGRTPGVHTGDVVVESDGRGGVELSVSDERLAELEEERAEFEERRRAFEGIASGPGDAEDIGASAEDRAEQLRIAAAEQDPLRDEGDFVVEDGEVRRRANPFFSDQREAAAGVFGIGMPEQVSERLTTDDGESRFRRGLQESSAWISDAATEDVPLDTIGGGPVIERAGFDASMDESQLAEELGVSERAFDVASDLRTGAVEALNIPGAALGGATVGEQIANIGQAEVETRRAELDMDPGALDPDSVVPDGDPGGVFGFDVAEDTAAADEREATIDAASQTVETATDLATERPGILVGGIATGAAVSVGGGVALGRGLTAGSDRIRTFGGQRIDADDIVNPDTRRVFDDGEVGQRFPPYQDPELAQSQPATAVRRQADEFTPEALERSFDDAGATEGSVLFRAMDVEPEGPETGRAAQGMATREGSYEAPGAFVGPELSPNFLRLGGGREFSPRPGLPDTGGRPTAVAIRTDVEPTDADTLPGFQRELLDRSGETEARAKPPQAINVGEAEAVIPPEAQFADVGGGFGRNIARTAGIGADYFTEIGGRRVPIRRVAPDDQLDSPSLFGDTRAQVGGAAVDRPAFRGELSDIGRVADTATDRPAPAAGSPVGGAAVDSPSGPLTPDADSGVSSPFADTFDIDSGIGFPQSDMSSDISVGGEVSPSPTASSGQFESPTTPASSPGVSTPSTSVYPSGPSSGVGIPGASMGVFGSVGGGIGSGVGTPAGGSGVSIAPPSDPGFTISPSGPGSPGSPSGPPPGGAPPGGPGQTPPPGLLEFSDRDRGRPEPEPLWRDDDPDTPEYVNPIAGVFDSIDFDDSNTGGLFW